MRADDSVGGSVRPGAAEGMILGGEILNKHPDEEIARPTRAVSRARKRSEINSHKVFKFKTWWSVSRKSNLVFFVFMLVIISMSYPEDKGILEVKFT